MKSHRFGELTFPEIGEAAKKDALIVLPIGTTEEHGPHLPVDTDARIARALGEALVSALHADGRIPALLMETICYGYSMRIIQRWPGTVVIRSRVLMDMVFDICCSIIQMGFNKIMLLDTHGHHGAALGVVSREVADATSHAIAVVAPQVMTREVFARYRKSAHGGEIHGGEWETSLVLFLSPELVEMSKATAEDNMRYRSRYVAGDSFAGEQRVGWSTWYLQESQNGIYGDPTVATAEMGKLLVETFIEEACQFAAEFWLHGREKASSAPARSVP